MPGSSLLLPLFLPVIALVPLSLRDNGLRSLVIIRSQGTALIHLIRGKASLFIPSDIPLVSWMGFNKLSFARHNITPWIQAYDASPQHKTNEHPLLCRQCCRR